MFQKNLCIFICMFVNLSSVCGSITELELENIKNAKKNTITKLTAHPSHMKSSLTFVIDLSGYTLLDVEAFKRGFDTIFYTVLSSNTSQIENFVLVTVDDSDKPVVITRDREVFKEALRGIGIHVVDAISPRMTMKGIELGLQASLPGSLLYVFTDARPPIADNSAVVKKLKILAAQKWTKVSFVLSGNCSGDDEVYRQIAKKSSGQVFNLKQGSEVEDILKYVNTQINGRKTVIAYEEFSAGTTNKFNFKVDSKMTDLLISVSGKEFFMNLTYPDGKYPIMRCLVGTTMFGVCRIMFVHPGIYAGEVKSTAKHSVVVTVDDAVYFDYVFSTSTQFIVTDTPVSGQEYVVFITIKDEDVVLDKVLIMEGDSVWSEMSLKATAQDMQFYKTETTFVVPYFMFKLAIIGHDKLGNNEIIRYSRPINSGNVERGAAAPAYWTSSSVWLIWCLSVFRVLLTLQL